MKSSEQRKAQKLNKQGLLWGQMGEMKAALAVHQRFFRQMHPCIFPKSVNYKMKDAQLHFFDKRGKERFEKSI